MAATCLMTQHRASKRHRCCQCRRAIEPGDVYVRSAIPPHDNDIGNTGWVTYVHHTTCPADESED
jgi:hypothetical protein